MEQLKLQYSFAKKHGVILQEYTANTATIIHKSAIDVSILTELARSLERQLILRAVSDEQFHTSLAAAYEANSNSAALLVEGMEEDLDLEQLIQHMPRTEDLLDHQDDAPIIKLLNLIFTQAIKQQASDIHLETFEQHMLVRMRVDGILHENLKLPRTFSSLIISRIKVMAKLDIAEKRVPQDGRLTLNIAGHAIDVRVSTLPANHGERAVLRLLDKKNSRLDLSLLGMFDDTLTKMRKLIAQPHGIVLMTGPTGSGKTTSLYSMLTELNQNTRNILTIEDPIEYDLPGIGQTQVNHKVSMTFAKGLRAILRQDPDVVMVGEIRDLETAEIAVQASLTGHLVLSTLHTNSALGAIARLRDMGIEAFLLSSSLIGVIAQRLVRKLCPHCKQAIILNDSEKQQLGFDLSTTICTYQPVGCEQCNNYGYLGRTGIYEVIILDDKLRSMIHEHESQDKLEKYVRDISPSIYQDGIRRVLVGETSIEEVLRVTVQD